jgi:hypothetical protein
MTNIVICCDGTWNTPDESAEGVPVPTNVVRIYNAAAHVDAAGAAQHKYYHPGVGTSGKWWEKALGGGTGRGLDQNIMSAYRELCDYYAPGDRMFLFGFSRGAYTVRSLCGLISACGLLDTRGLPEPEIWARVERVFQQGYRRRAEQRATWEAAGYAFHNAPGVPIPIRFLGVWDTVGALGIPEDMALLSLLDNLRDFTFHNTGLSASVETARHAVAMDEMRASFQPTLWSAPPGADAQQVWFPGVHSDVGGGYREVGLSDGALQWMVHEAAKCGLAFSSSLVAQIRPNVQDTLHNSCKGVFRLLPTQPRSIPRMAEGSDIHASALQRHASPPIDQCPYRQVRDLAPATPARLEIFAAQPWNETGIWLEAGVAYRFAATGEWMDRSIKCTPEGEADGKFQAAEIAYLVGDVLGKAEDWFRKLTGNKEADFRFTRRQEDMPWFCLVGAIANGGGVDEKGRLELPETFAIGVGCTYVPQKSGYLFAYANDAWNAYGNNRGRVQLDVKEA